MIKKVFVLSSVSLLLTGCPNPPKPVPKPHSKVVYPVQPTWVLQPPNDTAQTLYGMGEGINRNQAIQKALADLSSRLGVKVSSQFETELRVQNRGYELTQRDSKQQVSTQVRPIEINQYQVVKTYAPLPTQIYVLIQSNKQQLAQNQKTILNQQITHYHIVQKNTPLTGHLQRYLFALQESKKLPHFKQTLATLKTLTPNANFKLYQGYINKVEQTLLKEKQAIKFQIIAKDHASRLFIAPLKDTLSADHLLASTKSPIQIRINTQVNKSRAYGFYINRYQTHLTVWDHQTQINGVTYNIKGQSGQNSQVAEHQAQARFKKAFDLNTLLKPNK